MDKETKYMILALISKEAKSFRKEALTKLNPLEDKEAIKSNLNIAGQYEYLVTLIEEKII